MGLARSQKYGTRKMSNRIKHSASSCDSNVFVQTTKTRLPDLLDNTLWNRMLAPSSKRIVYAAVQWIDNDIREFFLTSAGLKIFIYIRQRISLH